jgi:light-regulated signal transduction histidine kinase (bacteriophytochrome)
VNLTGIARLVIEELREREPQRKFVAEIAEGMTASGDAPLMKVVLSSLLANAWKFTQKKEEARISMSLDKEGGQEIFCVRDNGAGFEMAYASKLFAPFQRLHGETEFDGTGIGLATVKRIVARHGGRVWATAEPEAGAAFFFTLEGSR